MRSPGAYRLAVRSEVHERETLGGFIMRLSEHNGLERVGWLTRAAGLPPNFQQAPCDLARLACMSGAGEEFLRRSAAWPSGDRKGIVRFGDLSVTKAVLLGAGTRVCPFCLDRRRLLPRVWQLLPNVACPKHQCLLVDRCPACLRRLGISNQELDLCRCGRRVSKADVESAPAALVELSAAFGGLEEGGRGSSTAAPLDLDAFCRLSWFVASSATADRWRSGYMSKPGVATLAPRLLAAAEALLDWPAGLQRWLAGKRRETPGRVGLAAEFGPWLQRLQAAMRAETGSPVFEVVREWLSRDWGRGVAKVSSHFHPLRIEGDLLTAQEAATRLGMSVAAIRSLVRSGRVRGEMLKMGGRTLFRVQASAVLEMASERTEVIAPSRVSEWLGVSPFQVGRLRSAGLLGHPAHPARRGTGRALCRTDVTDFLSRLATRAMFPNASRPEIITLAALALRRQFSFTSVVESILAGHLPCIVINDPAAGGGLRALAVSVAEVAAGSEDDLLISGREAASHLGMSLRMIPVLVRAGCIRTATTRNGKRRVARSSLLAFEADYTTARRMGAMTGTAARKLASRLASLGIVPVVAPDSSKGISAVWCRREVERAST